MKLEGRSRWISEGGVLARRLSGAIEARRIPGDEVLFVIVSRGGLLLLPAVLTQFPVGLLSVITCSRSQGISHSMPIPTKGIRLAIVVDAVVATGTTSLKVVEYVRERVGTCECWVASLSCTSSAHRQLEAGECKVLTVTSDTLTSTGPTLDLDGADAGDLLQGFVPDVK